MIIAESGVVPLRLGAGATHLRRGEPELLPVNVLIGALGAVHRDRAFRPALALGGAGPSESPRRWSSTAWEVSAATDSIVTPAGIANPSTFDCSASIATR